MVQIRIFCHWSGRFGKTSMYEITMYTVVKKLKVLKERLKELNLTEYSNLKGKTKDARRELEEAQEQLQLAPLDKRLKLKVR